MSDHKKRGLAVPNPNRRQCSATSSRSGERCKKPPIKGGTVCATHGGRAPQVRKKAMERIIAASDLAAARLIEFMNDKRVPYNVRLAATKDLLDRGLGPAAQTIRLGVGDADPWQELLEEIMTDDVLVPVDSRALPSRPRGGGLVTDAGQDDDEPGPDVQVIEYDPDPDVSSDDLSFDVPGTIRGEVVPPRVRPRRYPIDDEELDREIADRPSEFSPRESGPRPDDPTMPPAYVREAMESDGLDWREPNQRDRGTTWTR